MSGLILTEYIKCNFKASLSIFLSIRSAYAFISSAIVGVWISNLYLDLIVFEYSGLSLENSLLKTLWRNSLMHLNTLKAFLFNFDINTPPLIGKLNLDVINGSKLTGSTPWENKINYLIILE